MTRLGRRFVRRGLLVAFQAAVLAPAAVAQGLPARLSDQEFWKLVTDASEADGFFQSDNFVSNELTLQYIIPELLKSPGARNVYFGVGPDQNFTYIAALKPPMAFIVDIRRGAMLQHLMYKALFEMAEDRAEFFSLLFSRPRPPGLGPTSTPMQILEAFYAVRGDTAMYFRTRQAIEDRLVRQHGFALSRDDIGGIDYVFTSFHLAGPDITYNYAGAQFSSRGRMPSFSDLVVATDAEGLGRGFLSTEDNYQVVRQLQLRNLLVPVVGDFAGPRALRAVGEWVRERGAVVGAIYTSNVEQYLFREPHKWRQYYENVASLPMDSSTTFVRAVFNLGYPGGGGGLGARSVTMLQPVHELLKALREGKLTSYYDLVGLSRTAWPP